MSKDLEERAAIQLECNPSLECTKPDQKHICDDQGECFLEPLTESDPDNSIEYEWYIPRLVPKGHPLLLASKGGVGKTTQILSFARTIIAADPEAIIVYIAAEGTYRDTKVKARRMGLDRYNGQFTFLKRKDGRTAFKLSDREDLPLVQKVLASARSRGRRVAMIIIDSIRGMYRGKMSEDLVGAVMNDINGVIAAEAPHCTVAYLSHNNKVRDLEDLCDQVLGSVTIINAVRHALGMVKTAGQARLIEIIKTNLEGEGDRFRCIMEDDGRIATSFIGTRGQGFEDAIDGAADNDQMDRADQLILSMLKDGSEVPAKAIYDAGEARNPKIHSETLKMAKKAYGAGILSFQKGKRWYWRMEPFLVKQFTEPSRPVEV
jgi:hypothetical protein